MGGQSNHVYSLGFVLRLVFVEHYMYHTPDDEIGQLLDANGYMYVDETNLIIANNLSHSEENEECNENWIDDGKFGDSLIAFPYCYFSSNLRLLQMRCNTLMYNQFALMPEMLAWVGQELGRTRTDDPDVWCFLRESELTDGPAKNFERWLYQRDTQGYVTEAVIPIDKKLSFLGVQSFKIQFLRSNDSIVHKGQKIGFAADDVVFPKNVEHNVAIKVFDIDNVVGILKLVYRNNNGTQKKTINTTGRDLVRTATWLVSAKFDASGFDYDFKLQCEAGKEVPISFVCYKSTYWS